jgi:hypothetical protein
MRFGEIGRERERLAVGRGGFLAPAGVAQQVAEVGMRGGLVGLQGEAAPVARDGLVALAAARVQRRDIDERVREIGVERERLAVALRRALELAQRLERVSQVGVRGRLARVDRQRLRNEVDRLCIPALLVGDDAEEVQRVEVARLDLEDPAVGPPGLVQAPRLVKPQGFSKISRRSRSGDSTTPFSQMIPVTSSAGVTSNAGLRTETPSGAQRVPR